MAKAKCQMKDSTPEGIKVPLQCMEEDIHSLRLWLKKKEEAQNLLNSELLFSHKEFGTQTSEEKTEKEAKIEFSP